MRGSWRTHIGAITAAVLLAAVTLAVGNAVQPQPVSAAYCDDYPVLCSSFTVNPQGTGAGSVTTADGSINCQWSNGVQSGTCTKRFIEDGNGSVTITVTYQAATGSYVCVGAIIPDCFSHSYTTQITFGSDTTRTVTFSPADCTAVADSWCHNLVIVTKGDGRGTVTTGDGFIDCTYNAGPTSGPCEHAYWVGPEGGYTPQIYVLGTAAAGSEVCEDGDCGATEDFNTYFGGDTDFTFSFNLLDYTVTVSRSGSGSGRVVGSPGGIDCGSSCNGTYQYGDKLTLAAVSNAGSTFQGWTGTCAGQDATCDLTISGAVTTAALFAATPGATAGTLPTAAPATQVPASAAPASDVPLATGSPSSGPDASGIDPSPAAPTATDGFASPAGSGEATAAPTVPVTGGGGGSDTLLLVLGMLLAAVIVAIGLAVGLRGRRSRTEDPQTGAPPAEGPSAG